MMMRIVLIFLLLCTPALAHDPSHPELNEWFNRLASGKGLCCSFADGSFVSDVDWEFEGWPLPRPTRGPMDRRSRRCRNHRAEPRQQNYGLAPTQPIAGPIIRILKSGASCPAAWARARGFGPALFPGLLIFQFSDRGSTP